MKILIVGMGYVGSNLYHFLAKRYAIDHADPSPLLNYYPPPVTDLTGFDIAFVCVPTPSNEDSSCDISIVKKVVGEIEADLIIIKSTIPPGTTEGLVKLTGKNIVFSPEFCSEPDYDPGHEFHNNVGNEPYFIFGGDKKDTTKAVDLFSRVAGPTKTYIQCTSREAEMIKYATNLYLGSKLVFTYELAKACESLDVDFNIVREGWLQDPRVTKSHTLVFSDNENPFGGKCLPKDIAAIVHSINKAGYKPEFFEEILNSNKRLGDK